MDLKIFGTENFKVDKVEKINNKTYNYESFYYITNIDNDGTTYVTKDTVDELISLLEYIKNLN